MRQKALGLYRRHTASTRRCYGLAIDRILHIAAGKNTFYIGRSRIGFSQDISLFVHLDLTFKDRRIRHVTNRHKNPFASELALFARLRVL